MRVLGLKNYIGQRSAVEMLEVLIWCISVLCVLGERGEITTVAWKMEL